MDRSLNSLCPTLRPQLYTRELDVDSQIRAIYRANAPTRLDSSFVGAVVAARPRRTRRRTPAGRIGFFERKVARSSGGSSAEYSSDWQVSTPPASQPCLLPGHKCSPPTFARSRRWGQAGALLSPNEAPTFVVVSGKIPVSGQTIDSTPATASTLALDLSEPIADLAAPPWSPFPSSGSAPIAANGALIPLSSYSGLFFGGDAASDPAIALPTGNDSSRLLSYPVSSTAPPSWTHELASLWPTQPQRRESVFAVSASNGTVTRSWIYGGLRPDGSGTAYDELWEIQTTINAKGQVASTPTWGMWQGRGGPPAMYDGTAVLLPASSDSPTTLPSILLIGGVQSTQGGATALSDLSTAWVFEPSDNLASGSWQKIKLANAPRDRRGHVAVPFGTGAIWIQGGRDLDGSTVYSDAAVLDVKGRRWTPTSSGQAVWGHSAVAVGETILLAFGEHISSPLALLLPDEANTTMPLCRLWTERAGLAEPFSLCPRQ